MAKIIYGNGIANKRGSEGADTYSCNQGGNYVKLRKGPTITGSSWYNDSVANFLNASNFWKEITDQQRLTWIMGTSNFLFKDSLGQTLILAPPSLFTKINYWRDRLGLDLVENCPLAGTEHFFYSFSSNIDGTDVFLNWEIDEAGNDTIPDDYSIIIKASDYLPPGTWKPKKSWYYFIACVLGPLSSPYDVTALYNARFPTPIANYKRYIEVTLLKNANCMKSDIRYTQII